MKWTVACDPALFRSVVDQFTNAGFTVQLHSDTLDTWEYSPQPEFKLMVSHQSSHALTLLLLRDTSVRLLDD